VLVGQGISSSVLTPSPYLLALQAADGRAFTDNGDVGTCVNAWACSTIEPYLIGACC